MIKVPAEQIWENVKKHFMSHRNEWIMESENLNNELALWLTNEYRCMIRGRKTLYFLFENEYDAEMFVMKFSAKKD